MCYASAKVSAPDCVFKDVGETRMQGFIRLFGASLLPFLLALQSAAQTFPDALAQAFPSRPVRMIVPFPPGGPTDLMARVFGQKLSEEWGQPVVIENRAGGNSAIGAQQTAKAAPDGYTLLVAMDTTLVMNPITTTDLPYNALKDFAPISLTAQNTSLLIVRAADGPTTAQELIARAKANPGKLNYGAGTITTRLAGYLFSKMAGIDTFFIPYKGSAEVVQGLLTGSIDFSIDGVAASLALIQDGKLRALAKLNNRPLSVLPDLQPLSIAANLPGLGEISTWAGLVAPAGTPPAIVDKIQRAVAKVAADSEVTSKLSNFGISAVSTTPAEFDRYFRSELDRWSKVFNESGIKLD
jgi:tripartite-type tricarboxylate transporter receptor subunit TctC